MTPFGRSSIAQPTFDANSQPGDTTFVAKITGSGSGASGTAHSWQKQKLKIGGGYEDETLIRPATLTQNPAYDLNGATVATNSLVFLKLRGWSDADKCNVYDIIAPASAGSTGGSGGGGGGGGTFAQVTYQDNISFNQVVSSGAIDLEFNHAFMDTGSYFDIANPTKLVIQKDGTYMIGANLIFLGFNAVQDGNYVFAAICRNGSLAAPNKLIEQFSGLIHDTSFLVSDCYFPMTLSCLAALKFGDYITLKALGVATAPYDVRVANDDATSNVRRLNFWIMSIGS